MRPVYKSKYTPWLLAVILLVTFFVYLPSLQNGFTNWDDLEQVVDNKDIKTLGITGTKSIFSSFYVGMYQPVTTQLYAIVYSAFGEDALAFHTFSLLLHLLNIILVFSLVRLFAREDTIALITAVLFALNPMQTESVAWVSATSNLLYTSFYLAGLITYLKYVRRTAFKHLVFTFILFVLSLLSKPTAVTFPIVILFIDLYFRRKVNLGLIIEKVPFLLLSILIGIVIIYAREGAGHIIDISERFGWGERFLMVFYAIAFYVTHLIAPTRLSAFHPYPLDGLPVEYYIAPLVTIMLVFLLFRLKGQEKRFVKAGFLFFLITIAIVLELIPVGVQVVKERYVYLPSIGLYFAFSALMLFLFVGKYKRMPLLITVLIVSTFSVITVSRAAIWKDSLSLWNDVLERYPNASAALINRGNSWQEAGDMSKAIADYSMAMVSEPGAADAYVNRALAYYKLENLDLSLKDFNHAIELGARDAATYNSRGLLRASKGVFEEAAEDFSIASELEPGNAAYLINLGLMQANLKDYESAQGAFDRAIELDSTSAKAYYWRGMVLLQLRRYNSACDDMKIAISLGWPIEKVPEFCR